jgi:ribose-phosphate pyrophosphokinase
VYAVPGVEAMARRLAALVGGEEGALSIRRFPDGESYVRLDTSPDGREVIIVGTLREPDDKLLPLAFLADAARELGARRVGLVTPYLAYMRQDRRFHDGEAVTSRSFARLVSSVVDWLVTVDPHLHRYASLDALYTIPTRVAHVAPTIGRWIAGNVRKPLIIGPDDESAQWATAVAAAAGDAPAIVATKDRQGDRDVRVTVPDAVRHRDRTPVLIDDILSTARTMAATVRELRAAGLGPPVCIAIHAIFAGGAEEALREAGVDRVVTCNTIPHPSNAIDVVPVLATSVSEMMTRRLQQ